LGFEWWLFHDKLFLFYIFIAPKAISYHFRRRLRVHVSAEVFGGVKGSFPVNGLYDLFECGRWWSKFLVDSSILELALTGNKRTASSPPASPAMGAGSE